jgi:hypothetical protein
MATAFTIGEMSTALEGSPLADNALFRGGGGDSDDVVVVHPFGRLQGARPVGPHGLFMGGLRAASEAVRQGAAPASNFKFFFNQCEWLPGALEREVTQGLWTAGVTAPGLCIRQVGSQSERVKNSERADSVWLDHDEPAWEILRREIKTAPTRLYKGVRGSAGADTPAAGGGASPARGGVTRMTPQKRLLIALVVERIAEFRAARDAQAVVAMLDQSAEVAPQCPAAPARLAGGLRWAA